MEEGVRDLALSIQDWSPEARSFFLSEVLRTTGRSFFDICPNASKEVARLLRRKKQTFTEYELRLLRDYVSDYPDGEFVGLADQVLSKTGA
jgi:hypothetical protein